MCSFYMYVNTEIFLLLAMAIAKSVVLYSIAAFDLVTLVVVLYALRFSLVAVARSSESFAP